MNNDIEIIISELEKANNILFVTGAGISVESGIPTYQEVGGLYNNNELIEGKTIEEIMSGKTILENPGLVWKCLIERSSFCQNIHFNHAHKVITEMEQHFKRVIVFSQNIDGLHRKAGTQNIIDIHGDIHNLYCAHCSHSEYAENMEKIYLPPNCQNCGAIMRPDVVFFGEALPNKKMMHLAQEVTMGFDVIFIIGTSGKLPYVVGPVGSLHKRGAFTVEINPNQTDISEKVNKKITGKAAEVLGCIWKSYQENTENPFF